MTKTDASRVHFLYAIRWVGVLLSVFWLAFASFSAHRASAATSQTINFQARLMQSSGAIVPDGTYNVEFKLYNTLTSSGSGTGTCVGDTSCLWFERYTGSNKISVANGYLTVELGTQTSLPSIDWSQNLYLTMNIGGTGSSPTWDGEMSPRLHLTAVPHAFSADQLSKTNGSLTSTLSFIQPATVSRNIFVPDEGGTLCIQNSANCGFALSSGSGNYIQNGTSLQSGANFNISGSGTAGSFLTSLVDTATVGGTLNLGTTNATSIALNKATGITGNLSQSGGTISLAATGTASLSATGALTLSGSTASLSAASGNNVTISTSGAGQVQIASGTGGIALKANGGNTVLNVDTSTNRVSAGVNSFGTTSATSTGQLYVSGANNAAIAGSVSTGNTTYRVATVGRYTYVQLFNALKVVDVAVPTSPVIVGSATTTSGVSALAAGAGYVYSLSNGGNTLQAIDVTNPSSPTVTTTVSVNSPYAAAVSGRYLYVATQDTTANFRVYDLANPGIPRLVTSLTASGGTVPYAIAIQGKYAYLASSTLLQSVNISNPAAPVSAGTLAVNSAISLAIQGKYAYLVNNSSAKLQVVNISNPASMTSVSNTIAVPTDAQEIAVQDRIAYVTSGTGNSLRWFDISNPASPVILGTYNAGSALRGLSVQGRYAYIADNGASALDVVDLGGAYLQQAEVGGLQATNLSVDSNAILGGDVLVGGSLQVAQSLQVNGNFSASGISSVFQSTTNSATAFQVQNASGTAVLNVDTTNARVGIGNIAPTVDLDVGPSTMAASQIVQIRVGDFLLQSQQGGANGLAALTSRGSNGNLTLDGASGSALYLSPFTTNNNYLAAGGGKVRVGSQTAPAYPLDVTGDINSSTQLRVGGNIVCTSTGCVTSGGSYIQNGTTVQSANMYVQAATSGSVAATLRANAAGTGDILDLKNGAGTNVMTVGSAGSTLIKTSTDATSAFMVQSNGGTTALNVDTTNARVGIGGITAPAVSLDVEGAVQQTGLTTSNTNGTDNNKWTLLGTCTIAAQYRQCIAGLHILGGHDGNTGDNTQATVTARVKQQNAMGGAPYVNITVNDTAEVITKADIVAVTTQNDATATVVQLYGRITNTYEQWYFTPTLNSDQSPSKWVWSQSAGFLAALPAGTQTAAAYGDSYANTLTIQSAATGTAFQIQNSVGTAVYSINTATGLVTQSGALKMNVTSANSTTFTTPLGSSVQTAINIPLYDPGAYGQILAFGLPSTAATTARAISVFDARSSGTIQPAIALFSPNENDVFGLSWNGLNTTASLETASAAIALRPGGTNVKLWAGSTGVAIGSNVSSAAYPLDVTGAINTSSSFLIGGSAVCDTTGSTGCIAKSGSGYYIHNQTTVQSSNMYIQSASSGTATAVLQANATSGNILNLVSGGGTTVGTVGNSGAVTLQNSANSTSAFLVQAAVGTGGNAVFRVDTTNERVGIGVISDPIGAKLSVATASTVALRGYQGGSSDAFQLGNATADFMTIGSTGNFLLKPTTNSPDAFKIQTSTGTNVFSAATSGGLTLFGPSWLAQHTGIDMSTNDTLLEVGSADGNGVGVRQINGGQGKILHSTDLVIQRESGTSGTDFMVQDASGSTIMAVDSTAAPKVTLGTADATGTLLVLDTKNDSTTDPTGTDGAMYYNSVSKSFRCYMNNRWRSCVSGVVFANTSVPAGNTVSNTTSETNFTSNYSIPANDCQPGRVYRITAQGLWSNSSGAAANLTLKVKAGTTALHTAVANSTATGGSNLAWRIEFQIICVTTGASGTVEAQGYWQRSTSTTAAAVAQLVNTGTVTLDTTSAQTLQISATWGTAATTLTTTMRQFIVEASGP